MLLYKRLIKSICLLSLFFPLLSCSENDTATTPAQALSSPARLSAIDTDTLLVSDYTENRFCTVDKISLKVVQCFAAKGQPTGVAYSAGYNGGRYFVGNRSVRSVDMFGSQGAFIGHLGGMTGLFGLVNDLTISEVDELVYVLDSKSAIITVYDFEGNLVSSDFTSGGLEKPSAIALGPDGRIYVSDFGNPGDPGTSFLDFTEVPPTIWVFSATGVLVDSLVGSTGGGMGGIPGTPVFSTPQGLYIDADNHLYVVDALSGEVQVFDLTTKGQVAVLGSLGVNNGELFYPLDVIVDAVTKDVFVADNRNGRIMVFKEGGVIP